jgi:hypothetical protein
LNIRRIAPASRHPFLTPIPLMDKTLLLLGIEALNVKPGIGLK